MLKLAGLQPDDYLNLCVDADGIWAGQIVRPVRTISLAELRAAWPAAPAPPAALPPAIWQRDRLHWSAKRYSNTSPLTFEEAGCLVCSYYALARWAGYALSLEEFAAALDAAGAFVDGEIQHPSRITVAFPRLIWHHDSWINDQESSFVDWSNRPVDLDVLRWVLARQPAPAKIDFIPGGVVQQHFAVAVEYTPDPAGGIYDNLLVMDSWIGAFTDARAYVDPAWLPWCERTGTTLVQRVLLGLRAPEVVD